jgi:hypothetical protein
MPEPKKKISIKVDKDNENTSLVVIVPNDDAWKLWCLISGGVIWGITHLPISLPPHL